MDRNNAGVIQARGGFGFKAKALQMRVGSPMTQTDHFEGNRAIETFLPRPVHDALTTTTDFFLEFVIAKVCKHSWLSRGAFYARPGRWISCLGALVYEKTKTCL